MFAVLLLILFSHVLQSASGRTFSNRSDVDTLLALKESLSDQRGVLYGWNTTIDICRWPGVSCSLKHKHRVAVLNLAAEGLGGTIAPSVGNLTFLKVLNLSRNNLQGEIPSSIGLLSRLQYLDLSKNTLEGNLNADLKNCTRLKGINLGTNRLTGEIPSWVGDLSSLNVIILQKNNFTGIIPPSLANLSALQKTHFSFNQLEGTIPDQLGRLNSLEYIALDVNHLSGTIETFFNHSSLIGLSVAVNELHGTLPSSLGNNLPNMKYLLVDANNFTGSIPASLANATMTYFIDFSFNHFTGVVPPEIGKLCPDTFSLSTNQLKATSVEDWEFMTFFTNCTRLRRVDLQDNMLGGELPNSVGNLSAQLEVLYLGSNEITGAIPFGISNLIGLTLLQLSHNRFTDVLPDSIGRLNSLQELGFEHNQLTGFLPSSLGNLTQLLHLYTESNKFEGSLPSSLGSLQEITWANFSNNMFTGPLPKEIFDLSSLSYALDLSDNNFVGPLPQEVGSLTKLSYLYISRNNLSGSLPNTLSDCQSLTDLRLDSNSINSSIPASISKMRGLLLLNLTNNTLSGGIPEELGLMSGIRELYLAHNNLSGHIPDIFGNMTSLYKLDLSFNQLDGKVPWEGVLSNISGFLSDGNLGLCGGISELHLPPCPPEKSMQHDMRKHHLIITVVTPIAGIITFLSLMLVFFTMRKKSKAQRIITRGFQLMDGNYPRISYAELVQGTSGFTTDNLIGRGRYGSVYKCGLLLKGMITIVAVKVFDLQQSGSSKSFLAECEALSKIRHRNLISVITCCSSTDSNREDFKALVFEFMPNGSLDRWLHLDVQASQQRQGLTLMQRLNIAVDIADALDYLHNNCEPPIIHCDLKPSNILLDEDLVAHIGDFGLAKILSESSVEQQINSTSSTGIRGTIGYVAPEYGEGGQVSSCGDVYSFGSVIIELFTGKAPTHDMFRDGLTLQKHAENAFPRMLMQIVDPVLLSSSEEASADGSNTVEHASSAIFSVMKVALSCSKHAPAERMCMRDAAAAMHKIRDGYVKNRQIKEVSIASYNARNFAEVSSSAETSMPAP